MRSFSTAALLAAFCTVPTVVHAQWTRTAGPPGITTTKFWDAGEALFVGTSAKGVFKSTDHGATWTTANSGIADMDVLCMYQDDSYLYAGTLGHGVYRSADLGGTWEPANMGMETLAVQCMTEGGGYLWAGMLGGVYRSADHGGTWTAANGGALTFSLIYAMVYRAPRLIVEADNYLYWTINDGDEWNVDQGSTAFYTIDETLQEGDTILAAANGTVFRSTNGGVDWSDAITVDPDIKIAGLVRVGDVVYAGHARGLYRSLDDGQSWEAVPGGAGLRFGSRTTGDFIASGGDLLLSFEEIGVYRSTDMGQEWAANNTGFAEAANIDNCLLSVDGALYTGTHSDGAFTSTDDGDSWQRVGAPPPLDTLANSIVYAVLEPSAHVFLIGTCGNGLYRSTNDGGSWTHITAGLPMQFGGFSCVNGLAGEGDRVAASTDQGMYYSSDGGLTWHGTVYSGTGKRAMCVAGTDSVMFASILNQGNSGLYRSLDHGTTWAPAAQPISDVVSLATDGDHHFYAGTFTGNYRTVGSNMEWNAVGPGIPDGEGGYTILARGAHVLIGNASGVYHSADSGGSFTPIDEGLDPDPNRAVQGLASSDTYVFAGLFRDGVWRRPWSDLGVGAGITEAKGPSLVPQLFPNPAGDRAMLHFPAARTGAGRALIHDATGRLVLTLNVQSGAQDVPLDLSTLAPGSYVLRVLLDRDGGAVPLRFVKR